MSKVYPGISIFPCTKPGSHSWLEDPRRPFGNQIRTDFDGHRSYANLFLGKHVESEVTDDHIVLKIPLNINKPFLQIGFKKENHA